MSRSTALEQLRSGGFDAVVVEAWVGHPPVRQLQWGTVLKLEGALTPVSAVASITPLVLPGVV